MKRSMVILVTALTLVALLVGASAVMAAKPSSPDHNVVSWSNGFPSGPHMNLNIHGKKWETCQAVPDEDGWGNSIFVPEDTTGVNILYKMHKKSGLSNLQVEYPCSFDGESATVRLPSGEYQVYARILAKPGKPGSGEPRNVVITPEPGLLDACNLPADYVYDPDDPWNCEEWDLMGLGVITSGGAYVLKNETLERIAPMSDGGGKGGKKNKAVSISDMFYWYGFYLDLAEKPWLDCYPSGDPDGQLTTDDLLCLVSSGYLLDADLNGDLVVDEADVDVLIEQEGVEVTESEPMWVFDLADLVIYGWDYENNGSKLVQIRFYPVGETDFIPVD